jgi:vacuolar iron transporter family protein
MSVWIRSRPDRRFSTLAFLGAVGAKAGGANIMRATLRVTFRGALALGVTAGIGKLLVR